MNVNRVRSLMLLVNLGLAGATGYTVYSEFKEKKVRSEQTETFYDQLRKDLEAAPKAHTKDATRASIKTTDLLDMTGDKPKPVVVESAASGPPRASRLRSTTSSASSRSRSIRTGHSRGRGLPEGGRRRSSRRAAELRRGRGRSVRERRSRPRDPRGPRDLQERRSGAGAQDPRYRGTPRCRRRHVGPLVERSGNRPFITYVESKKDSGNITIKPGGNLALSREGEQVLDGVIFSSTDSAKGGKALRVDTVPPDSVLAKHGVQNGDVLVSVNGVAMSTKSEVVDYVKRNKTMSVFEVAIQRRGNIVTKTITVER